MSDSLLTILEMIEEVVAEELLAKKWQDMFSEPATVKSPMDNFAQEVFKILKPESKPGELLTPEDFEVLNAELDSEDEQVSDTAYKKTTELAKFLDQGLKQNNKMKKDFIDAISQQDSIIDVFSSIGLQKDSLLGLLDDEPDSELGVVEPTIRKSITSPNIIEDAQSLAGVTRNVIGSNANDPSSLLRALEEISKFSQTASQQRSLFDESGYNSKNASKIILLDYINSMISSTESGVAGYAFEYLMAGICGGQQLGVTTTESGKMGAVDFEMGSGFKGSCKLYSNFSNIGQAVNGFEEGKPVFYTIGIKNKGASGNVLSIDLWTVTIEMKSKQMIGIYRYNGGDIINQLKAIGNPYSSLVLKRSGLFKGKKKVIGYYDFTMNDLPFPVLVFEGQPTNIPISQKAVKKTNSKMFQFSFESNDTENFRQQLSKSFDQESKTIITTLSKIVDNIMKTKNKTQEYFSSGDANAGLDAFSAVYNTEENLKTLASSVSGEESAEYLQKKAKKT
tara:strand:+ start:334 stop:1854 length:1521 start_codon:yes stop_codon:yes gene_type:complete